MTALAEKMKEAGVDTIGARLTAACIEAIRCVSDDPEAAWRYVGTIFGHEFVRVLIKDIEGISKPEAPEFAAPKPVYPASVAAKPYEPRVIAPERLEKRRKLQQVVRSRYMNSGGIAWSDVGWHELHGLSRDGNEARALLDAGPAHVPNDGRSVGDVLGIKKIDEIIGNVRESLPVKQIT